MDETKQASLDIVGVKSDVVTMGDLEKILEAAEKGDSKAIRQIEALYHNHEELFEGLRDTFIEAKKLYNDLGDTDEERHENFVKLYKEVFGESDERTVLSILNYKSEDTKKVVSPVGKVVDHMAKIDQSKTSAGKLTYGKKDFVINVSFSLEDESVEVPKLTTFDTRVLNAVCSFHHEGLRAFTATQVYKRMNGITSLDYKVDEVTLKAIRDSIQKMRVKLVKIDVTKLVENGWKFKNPVKKVILDDYVLPLKHAEIRHIDGTVQEGWALHAEPIIYTHCVSMNDLETYSPQLLNYPGNKTQKKGDIFHTLLTNVVSNIKRVKNENPRRTYKGIMEAAGLDVENMSRKVFSDNVKIIRSMLDHIVTYDEDVIEWKEIKDMRNSKGEKLRGVEITVNKTKKKYPRKQVTSTLGNELQQP